MDSPKSQAFEGFSKLEGVLSRSVKCDEYKLSGEAQYR